MPSMMRALLWITTVLLVPVVPLLILGLSFEERIEGWFAGGLSDPARFLLIILVLAIDLFLPVPSSMVSTYGGGVLGTALATLASWIGMTAGAILGFALARQLGGRFTSRYAADRDLQQMALIARRHGPLSLVLTRALPILAEACVLLMGSSGMSWKRFLPPVLISNLIISLTYAAAGEYFHDRDALPAAVVLSGTIPLLIAVFARRWLPQAEDPPTPNSVPDSTAQP